MAVTTTLFDNVWDQALSAPINWPSDTIKMALLTSSASPNLATWIHYSDLTNEVASGSGYTTGGATLGTKTHVVTPATSWSTGWSTTTWTYGQIIKNTGGTYLFECTTAGTSSGSAPTFPSVVGQTVTDSGGVVWTNIGESVTIWSSAAAQWTSATFSAAYGVIYDSTPGSGSTDPLIALVNFGATLSPVAGTLTVTPDSTYGWFLNTPA